MVLSFQGGHVGKCLNANVEFVKIVIFFTAKMGDSSISRIPDSRLPCQCDKPVW